MPHAQVPARSPGKISPVAGPWRPVLVRSPSRGALTPSAAEPPEPGRASFPSAGERGAAGVMVRDTAPARYAHSTLRGIPAPFPWRLASPLLDTPVSRERAFTREAAAVLPGRAGSSPGGARKRVDDE